MQMITRIISKVTPACGGVRKPPVPVAAAAVLTAALTVSVCATALSQQSGFEESMDSPQVAGFRSARFGMLESETLEAIQRDFQIQPGNISAQTNDGDRTTSLTATVAQIFPGSGPTQVVYIHGYRDGKLIQVNILWGSPGVEDADPQELVTTANLLRNYFIGLGFDPENTVVNTRVDDRVLVVFRAVDEQGRMVLLQLVSTQLPAAGEEEADPKFRVASLLLSYIENTRDPDVFQIRKGLF